MYLRTPIPAGSRMPLPPHAPFSRASGLADDVLQNPPSPPCASRFLGVLLAMAVAWAGARPDALQLHGSGCNGGGSGTEADEPDVQLLLLRLVRRACRDAGDVVTTAATEAVGRGPPSTYLCCGATRTPRGGLARRRNPTSSRLGREGGGIHIFYFLFTVF